MATYTLTLPELVVRPELHGGMEQLLKPDALARAQSELREQEEAPEHDDRVEEREGRLAEARADVARGGSLHWIEYDVADEHGVTRTQRGSAGDGSLWRPPLLGATELDLTLSTEPKSVYYGLGVQREEATTLSVYMRSAFTNITINTSDDRIEALRASVQEFFQSFVEPEPVPEPPTFKVFIGHGGDPQWKYLHRALNEMHGIRAEAFESAERAGYHTLAVVDQMVRSSTVAVVVMTGELHDEDGTLRARENVVHEVGFCQGVLGISNTIVVLQEGVSEPSNIAGLTQVRFHPGQLIDVEERIVAVLRQRQQVHSYQQG